MTVCLECGYFGRDLTEGGLKLYQRDICNLGNCFYISPDYRGTNDRKYVSANKQACHRFYRRGEEPVKPTRIGILFGEL